MSTLHLMEQMEPMETHPIQEVLDSDVLLVAQFDLEQTESQELY